MGSPAMTPPEEMLMVTGASGRLGQLVLRELIERQGVDPMKIVAITRTPDRVNFWKERGVVVRRGDFNDEPLILREAFKGGRRALIIAPDDLNNRRKNIENAIREAVEAGVDHILFTGVVTQPKDLPPFMGDLLEIEENVLHEIKDKKGITYTVLGFNLWMETHMDFLRGEIALGTLCTTTPNGKVAFISREDYARACAAALASTKEMRDKYELTGPEAMDRHQLATAISNAMGFPKPLEVRHVAQGDLIDRLGAEGMPNPTAHFWVEHIERTINNGGLATVNSGFFDLTGMKPETFEAFVKRSREIYAPMPKM